jgi:hypothetical protein
MIDSAFTGMVYSRSLVTSGRRRETTLAELDIPRSSARYRTAEGIHKNLGRPVRFSGELSRNLQRRPTPYSNQQLKPYNDPAEPFLCLPLSSLVNLRRRRCGKGGGHFLAARRVRHIRGIMEERADYMGMVPSLQDAQGRTARDIPSYNIFKAPVRLRRRNA